MHRFKLETLNSKPFSLIVDIGARDGEFAVLAAKLWPDARIVAVEPYQAKFCKLCHAAAHFPNIQSVHAAVGHRTRPLHLGPNEVVAGLAAEELFAKLEIRTVDLLKIDTPGTELLILEQLELSGRLADIQHIRGFWSAWTELDRLADCLEPTHRFCASLPGGLFTATRR